MLGLPLSKARVTKYKRRTGSPGKYKYEYDDPKPAKKTKKENEGDLRSQLEKLVEHPDMRPINGDEKRLRARVAGLGYYDTCSRCGGSGRYSFNQMHGDMCYGCSGSGKVSSKITPELVADIRNHVKEGGLDRYVAEVKKKNEVATSANAAEKEVGDAVQAMEWRKYHYPPELSHKEQNALDRFSFLSYRIHDIATDAERRASDLVFETKRLRGAEREAAVQKLHELKPKLVAAVHAADQVFSDQLKSGALDADRKRGQDIKARDQAGNREAAYLAERRHQEDTYTEARKLVAAELKSKGIDFDEVFPAKVKKSLTKSAAPYIGPKGGKWADPKHTVAWHADTHAPMRIMGMAVVRKQHHVDDQNVSFELYKENGGKGGAVRVMDLDAQHAHDSGGAHADSGVIHIQKFSDFMDARDHYIKQLPKKATMQRFAKSGGPYYGPRGGKWADAKHTISWQEPEHPAGQPRHAGEWERDPRRSYADLKDGDTVEVGGMRGHFEYVPKHAASTSGTAWVRSRNTGQYKLVPKGSVIPLRPKKEIKAAPPRPVKRTPPPKRDESKKLKVIIPTSRTRYSADPDLHDDKPAPPDGSLPVGAKVPMVVPVPTSNAHEGTLMHDIEHGKIPLMYVKDEKYKGWRWGMALTPQQSNQLAEELAPLINKVVHTTGRKYNINFRRRQEAIDDVRQAAYQGMTMAISRYKGGASFGWLVKQLSTLYAQRAAAELMHAGTVPDHKLALVRGYIAARHQARAIAKDEPTLSQIAAQWHVTKRHVFEGEKARLGKYRKVEGLTSKIIDQSSETLPMDDWKLLDPSGKPVDERLYMGKKTLMTIMDSLASGNHVLNSDWMEANPTLPAGGQEPLAMRRLLLRDAHKVLEQMPKKEAKALQMLFGFAPYDEPKRREEIAEALKLGPKPKPGRKTTSEITKRRAANEFIDNAAKQFKLIAEHQHRNPEVSRQMSRWLVRVPDSPLEGFEVGPSGRELEARFGTAERVKIYEAAVRAGHGKRTAKILEKEMAGTATPAEERRVRKEFHAQRDKDRIAQFKLYTSHRSIPPEDVHDTGPQTGTPQEADWLYSESVVHDYIAAIINRGGKE